MSGVNSAWMLINLWGICTLHNLILLEFLWSTQVLIARSSMLALPCPVLPAFATHYACNILASRLWRRNVYAVCAVCVCVRWVWEHAICDSYSYSYNAYKACVDILLRWEQEQQRVRSYFSTPYTSVEQTMGYAMFYWVYLPLLQGISESNTAY